MFHLFSLFFFFLFEIYRFYLVFSHGHFFPLFSFSARFRPIDMRLYAYTYLQLCMVAIWILCENQLYLFVLHPISELTCIIYLSCFHLINLTKPTSNGGSLKLLCLLFCLFFHNVIRLLGSLFGRPAPAFAFLLFYPFDWDREEWIVCISSGLDPDGWYQCQ